MKESELDPGRVSCGAAAVTAGPRVALFGARRRPVQGVLRGCRRHGSLLEVQGRRGTDPSRRRAPSRPARRAHSLQGPSREPAGPRTHPRFAGSHPPFSGHIPYSVVTSLIQWSHPLFIGCFLRSVDVALQGIPVAGPSPPVASLSRRTSRSALHPLGGPPHHRGSRCVAALNHNGAASQPRPRHRTLPLASARMRVPHPDGSVPSHRYTSSEMRVAPVSPASKARASTQPSATASRTVSFHCGSSVFLPKAE